MDELLRFRGAKLVSLDNWIAGRWGAVIVMADVVRRLKGLKAYQGEGPINGAHWLRARDGSRALGVAEDELRCIRESKRHEPRRIQESKRRGAKKREEAISHDVPFEFRKKGHPDLDRSRTCNPQSPSDVNPLGYVDDSFNTPIETGADVLRILSG